MRGSGLRTGGACTILLKTRSTRWVLSSEGGFVPWATGKNLLCSWGVLRTLGMTLAISPEDIKHVSLISTWKHCEHVKCCWVVMVIIIWGNLPRTLEIPFSLLCWSELDTYIRMQTSYMSSQQWWWSARWYLSRSKLPEFWWVEISIRWLSLEKKIKGT